MAYVCDGPTPTDLDVVEYCVLRSLYESARDGVRVPVWTPDRLGVDEGLWKIAMVEISDGVWGVNRVTRRGKTVGASYDDDVRINQLGIDRLLELIESGVEDRIASLGFPLVPLDTSDACDLGERLAHEDGIRFVPYMKPAIIS